MQKSLTCAGLTALLAMSISSCTTKEPGQFDYIVDNFADIQVLRYKVPEFDSLSLQQKQLVYHLTEAALSGRDILWDQNGKYNLAIRDLLEQVYKNYDGAKDNADYLAFETYLKQIWFANGIHHHYSMDKFQPKFSREFLETEIAKLPKENLPKTDLLVLYDVIFNPETMPKKVNQAEGQDLILTSASNIYEGVTQPEVEAYYASIKDTTATTPVSYGLNTKKIKVDGKVVEQPYKIGGLYTEAIERIVSHLKAASEFAENPEQKAHIEKLIEYYTTGSLKNFDEYSILWVKDTDSQVDFINGFIESYDDPLGMTGSWESIVNFKNRPASRRTEAISAEAQWFENNSPVDSRFKKETVKGVTAKVITAAILAGDAYPATPIGINLPNANWIRATHGSKSVTLENITQAYDEASHGSGFNEEFVIDKETSDLLDKYLFITDNLHTDLHECLGHGSGKLLPGVDPDALKAYGSTLEEARADLFALYYLADPKLIELGLLDSPDAYKAEYYKYILNGLMTQLMRIEPGKDVEEAHMRNRKLIAEWCFQKGGDEKVIELVKRDGKTYVRINDYPRLRERIKSEGDYEAGRKLVETYGVRVDPEVHAEVLKRYEHLNIAPYKGFVNPVYELVKDSDGNVTDVTVRYDEDYVPQMLRYSKDYSSLPR